MGKFSLELLLVNEQLGLDNKMKQIIGPFLFVTVLLTVMMGGILTPVGASEPPAPTDTLAAQQRQPARIPTGEPYSQVFTNEMAEEIAVWVLETYPELPFTDPHIEIHEDGIICSGKISVFGIEVAASGHLSVFVEDGKVNGKIETIEVAGLTMPSLLMGAIDDVRSLYESATWEIIVTTVELKEGEMLVEGEYR